MRIATNAVLDTSRGVTIERDESFTSAFAAAATAFFRSGNTITLNGHTLDDAEWTLLMSPVHAGVAERQASLRQFFDLPGFDYHDFKLMVDDIIARTPVGSVAAYGLSNAEARRHGIIDRVRRVRHDGERDVIEVAQRSYGRSGSLRLEVTPGVPTLAAPRIVRVAVPSACPPPPVCPPAPSCSTARTHRDDPAFSSGSRAATHSAVGDAIEAAEL